MKIDLEQNILQGCTPKSQRRQAYGTYMSHRSRTKDFIGLYAKKSCIGMLVASRSRQTLVRTMSPYWIYIAASVKKKKRKCGHIHSLIVKVHIVRSMNSFILKMKHRKYKRMKSKRERNPEKFQGSGRSAPKWNFQSRNAG